MKMRWTAPCALALALGMEMQGWTQDAPAVVQPKIAESVWPSVPMPEVVPMTTDQTAPAPASSFLSELRTVGWFGLGRDDGADPVLAADGVNPLTGGTVPWRFSLREDIGNGVGYRNGYTYLEGFIPVWQPYFDSVSFADLRVVNYSNADRWEYNLGGGYRRAIRDTEWVLGANLFYDGRQHDGRYFNQLGFGFEVLSSRFEWRGNGYFILGDSRKEIGAPIVTTTAIGINQLITSRQRIITAMDGLDTEIGAPIPFLERYYTRAYLGAYHYTGEGVRSLTGFRSRLESQLTTRISLHLAYQTDPVFGNTISGGLAFAFGAPAYRSGDGAPTLANILGQRVVRDVDIVLQEGASFSETFIPGTPPPPPPVEQPGGE